LFLEQTPIEQYWVAGTPVHVKRDDLYGSPPAPPLGKLRGLRLLLGRLYEDGARLVGCWDTRVSKLGQGLAACCTEFPGLRCIVSYPARNGESAPEPVQAAERLGAMIHPVPATRLTICFARARAFVTEAGGLMLPFGLECSEAVEAVRREASRVPPDVVVGGTIILSCGSGVTLAGVIKGLQTLPARIVGLSAGRSLASIRSCVQRYVKQVPSCLELRPPTLPYSKSPTNVSAPFPCHPSYDLKAWALLTQSIEKFAKPILFWNIGA